MELEPEGLSLFRKRVELTRGTGEEQRSSKKNLFRTESREKQAYRIDREGPPIITSSRAQNKEAGENTPLNPTRVERKLSSKSSCDPTSLCPTLVSNWQSMNSFMEQ